MVEDLLQHGSVPRAWSGLTLQPRLAGAEVGALVADVAADSPAAEAGLRPGDTLLSLGGVEADCSLAEDMPTLTARLVDLPVGRELEAHFLRGGETHRASMTLLLRQPALYPLKEQRRLGFTYRDISRQTQRRLGLSHASGVVVDGVVSGGRADAATLPLMADDVIIAVDGSELVDGSQLSRLLAETQEGTTVFTVQRGGQQILLAIQAGPIAERRAVARPKRAWLPVETQLLSADLAQAVCPGHVGAFRVTQVLDEDLPLQVGDILTAVEGEALAGRRASDPSGFLRRIERHAIGSEVQLSLLRDGEAHEVQVSLSAPPPNPDFFQSHEDDFLEFEARTSTPEERDRFAGIGGDGAQVLEVAEGGWADLAGLKSGDLILEFAGQAVHGVESLASMCAASREQASTHLPLLVGRGNRTLFLEIEPAYAPAKEDHEE